MNRLTVLVVAVAFVLVVLTGCGKKSEHPESEHPTKEQPSSEQPKSEHPTEHPD